MFCNDFGDEPLCLREADERYTMDFNDVEPGAKIYWCAFCGPRAHAVDAQLQEFFDSATPAAVAKLEEKIDEAIERRKAEAN